MSQFPYRFNDFTGGIADNPSLAGRNQFVDSKDINIRDNIPLLKLSSEAVAPAVVNTTKAMYCAVDNYFFGADGYIYATNQANAVATTSGAGDILGCAKYDGRYIRWEDGATPLMGKIDVTDADDDSNREDEPSYDDSRDHLSGTALTGWNTYRLAQSSYGVSTVHFAGNLYFSNANQVLVLDTAEIVTQGLTNLPYDIVALTVYGSRIEIWLENGEVLFWDGVSTSWDEAIPLGERIYLVGGSAGVTYIVTGASSQTNTLWRKIGYDIQKLKTTVCGFEVDYGGDCASMGIAVYDGIAYVPGGGNADGVYTYGSPYAGIGESLNFEYGTSPEGLAITSVHMIYSYGGNVFISYSDGTNIGIAQLSKSESAGYATGHVTTLAFDGGLRTQKKRITRIDLHGQFSDTNKAVIAYRKDKTGADQYKRSYILASSPSFTTLIDTDNLTNGTTNRVYGTSLDVEFYDIQFKISLSGTATLSDMVIYYEYVNE